MNAPANRTALVGVAMPWLEMEPQEVITALGNSVYPGAQVPSIKMVMGYCQAQQLDPFLKPVHIVPMSVTVKSPDPRNPDRTIEQKVYRDVIMPGIGLYRITAHRTQECAGIDEPVYGPMKVMEWPVTFEDGEGVTQSKTERIEYPEWCSVTVYRIKDGERRAYTAKEYWLENYATAGARSTVPNAMWRKRPIGQLGKCAEAQALRRAFPEVGSAPTAEEMVGKTIDDLHEAGVTVDAETGEVVKAGVQMPTRKPAPKPEAKAEPKQEPSTSELPPEDAPPPPPADEPERQQAAAPKAAADDQPARPSQVSVVRAAMKRAARTDTDLIAKYNFTTETMPASRVNEVLDWLRSVTPA